MAGWLLSLRSFLILLCLSKFLVFLELVVANAMQPSCHDNERSALLQFKQSFIIDELASDPHAAYPKVLHWRNQEGDQGSNCCLWDGVECDEKTGRVIGLDLSSSCLHGPISSSSSLFRLVHLRRLNLADNHFNFSRIPAAIGRFSAITHLSLSLSVFSGQIPLEISYLSKLSSLDLSLNVDKPIKKSLVTQKLLQLQLSNFKSLVQNLTHLEELGLGAVDILSTVPDLSNLSSLTDLFLRDCGLSGPIPSSLGFLSKLEFLDLGLNRLNGYIPSSLQNLTRLDTLRLDSNNITGPIPSWLGNHTHLLELELKNNELIGSVPQSLSRLMNLRALSLAANNLEGTLEFDMFFSMKNLIYLYLSGNKLSLLFGKRNVNATLSKFKGLRLSTCNLIEFPDFLRYQNELELLDLSNNKIHGGIPEWMSNTSLETLLFIRLSGNFLTSFHRSSSMLPWVNLRVLDLNSNMLQGQVPLPPSSITYYDVSHNNLTGEIPLLMCNSSSLQVLDLSSNNLDGTVPQCLGGFSDSVSVLNLRRNSFHGIIPETCSPTSNLRMVDFGHNQFHGQLPRSLATCVMLEYLDLSNNKLIDVFPTWLATLHMLKLFSIRKNGFYGVIGKPEEQFELPNLRVIDLSYNNFTGELPFAYVFAMNAVKLTDNKHLSYENTTEIIDMKGKYSDIPYEYDYSITIAAKGVERNYEKILEVFAFIDFSSNKFSGEITELIGILKGLNSLNFSNNMLTGHIPPSLCNLLVLESLDLSHNKLSGGIPQQLTQLTFLESLDVSHNELTGPIPQGQQLSTFDSSSFADNPGLCGKPLANKCENPNAFLPPSSAVDYDDSESQVEFLWFFVVMGYASGLVVGVVLGSSVITKRHLGCYFN